MSDEFQRRPPPGDPEEPDDEAFFNWEMADDESSPEDELSWEPAGDEPPDAELDWQPTPAAFGAASMDAALDWLANLPQEDGEAGAPTEEPWFDAASPAAPPPPPANDLPPWLKQADALEEPAAPEPARADETPDWLRLDEPFAISDAPSAAPPEDDLPPWLQGAEAAPEPTPAPEPPPAEALPPWLAGLDEEIIGPPLVSDTGELSEDWLARAEQIPATGDLGLTYDEWMARQEAAARVPDVDEEAPDLREAFDEPLPEPAPGTGELPAWALGLEELDASAAPDWLHEEAPPAPPARSPAETKDLFEDFDLPEPALDALFEPFDAETAPPTPEEARPADDVLAGLELESPTKPDWAALAGSMPPPVEIGPIPAPQDIFEELGLPSPETGYDFLDQPAAAPAAPEWFAESEAAAAPDWLEELSGLDLTTPPEPAQPEPEAAPADADLLAALRGAAAPEPGPEEFELPEPSFDDLDSLLASYEAPEVRLPTTDRNLLDPNPDIDRLLSDSELEQIAARRSTPSGPTPPDDSLDWLREMGVSVGPVSAAAILRRQAENERPLEELNERLQQLHQRGQELPPPADSGPSDTLQTLLPGIKQFIAPTPVRAGLPGLSGELALSPQQMEKVSLLRTLAAVEEETPRAQPPSAIDLTYEARGLEEALEAELEPVAVEAEAAAAAAKARQRRRLKLDHLLISLALALAVTLPFFVSALRIGDLPPVAFAAGSRQEAAFEGLNRLRPGDLALVAAEYGPTGAGELDGLLDALLRHALLRGARPVLVSTNPLGVLHAQNVLNRLAGDPAFIAELGRELQSGRDYVMVRYLAGSVIGLRAFSQNLGAALATSSVGTATGLAMTTAGDFAAIVIVAERAEDVRAWAEQVTAPTGKPLIAAVSQAAAPLSEPYLLPGSPAAQGGFAGMLVGYRDAYTYRALLQAIAPDTTPPLESEAPRVIPSEATATPAPSDATTPQTAPSTPAPAEPGTDEAAATGLPDATETAGSPAPITGTPEAPALPVITGLIAADSAVNVREGPARTFAPVAALQPGSRIQVIGRTADSQWYQVRLEDGREGWISAELLTLEEPAAPATPTPAPTSSVRRDANAVVSLISDAGFERAAQEATPEPAPEQTVETAFELPPAQTAPAVGIAYRDERWYGMTLGTLAASAIIGLGAVGSIIGSLFRRRRR